MSSFITYQSQLDPTFGSTETYFFSVMFVFGHNVSWMLEHISTNNTRWFGLL